MNLQSLKITQQTGRFREQVDLNSPIVKVYKATSAATDTVFAYTISELGVDKDGMPDAYAPPVSATNFDSFYPNLQPQDSILNAIKHREFAFTQDPAKKWYWAGVDYGPKGAANADSNRGDWLKDSNNNYPIKNTRAPYINYYKTRTAIPDQNLNAVHAGKTPFGVLNGLPNNGIGLASAGVKLGDYGVVFRMDKPLATPFIFADVQGGKSPGCWEFSKNVSDKLGRGKPVGVLAFPRSAIRNDRADTDTILEKTTTRMMRLNGVDNIDDLIDRLVGDDLMKRWVVKLAFRSFWVFPRPDIVRRHKFG